MTYSTVTLDTALEPKFPDRCVVCGKTPLGEHVEVSDRAFTWLVFLNPLLMCCGKFKSVQVPVCRDCHDAFERQRLMRNGILVGGFVLVVAIGYPIMHQWEHEFWPLRVMPVRMLLLMAAGLLLLSPFILWEAFRPRHFCLDPGSRRTSYHFRQRDCATEFARINGGTVED